MRTASRLQFKWYSIKIKCLIIERQLYYQLMCTTKCTFQINYLPNDHSTFAKLMILSQFFFYCFSFPSFYSINARFEIIFQIDFSLCLSSRIFDLDFCVTQIHVTHTHTHTTAEKSSIFEKFAENRKSKLIERR